ILIVNSHKGVIIVEPNTLVSSTTLVQALWCARKAVLSEKFRVPQINISMTLGTVCHELFQSVLRRQPKIVSPAWLLAEFRRVILPKLILDLVILDVTIEQFEAQLKPYLTNITTWMRTFLPAPYGNNTPLSDGNKISDIEDIEMNIWSNGVGIKGKIDVALRTAKNRVIPLELKTGKSSYSIDHHAQVLMYTVLISELEDGKLDSGVLLYLKDGTETTVTPSVADLKGILQTRNGMATFSRALNIESFPEPKLETRFCGKCQFSRHCTVLQKLAPTKSMLISEEMEKFTDNSTLHLTEKELEYSKQWLEWTFMEWKADRKRKNMEGIFMEKPKQRFVI
uniref:DNA replication ATP-dependent helicase/nuclease DNA2 n=1 Tax=Panagrolaimus sp. ES5 TaxID=591445 RepID=A0AC34GAT2_9BILA